MIHPFQSTNSPLYTVATVGELEYMSKTHEISLNTLIVHTCSCKCCILKYTLLTICFIKGEHEIMALFEVPTKALVIVVGTMILKLFDVSNVNASLSV